MATEAENSEAKQREQTERFYRLVGECITSWAGIESKLFRIFRLLLHTDRQFAAILFYGRPTISSRFDLVSKNH